MTSLPASRPEPPNISHEDTIEQLCSETERFRDDLDDMTLLFRASHRPSRAEGGMMPKKMDPRYEPITDEQKLGYFVEECGEALAAAGKSLRWGLDSVNPELLPEEQEQNRMWLRRELNDVQRAINYLMEIL